VLGCTYGMISITPFLKSNVNYIEPQDQPPPPNNYSGCSPVIQFVESSVFADNCRYLAVCDEGPCGSGNWPRASAELCFV
jgi:hypothetical protein